MSDIEVKKQRIKDAYFGSLRWSEKVDKMSDAQVLAVFAKLTREGKIK